MPAIFFFQAEDGIRVADVTGVQTCALPISLAREHCEGAQVSGFVSLARLRDALERELLGEDVGRHQHQAAHRSEERRVGKERRAGGWLHDEIEMSEIV